jgi:hypothetical protein
LQIDKVIRYYRYHLLNNSQSSRPFLFQFKM